MTAASLQSARKSGKLFSAGAGGRGLYRIVSTMPDSLIPSLIAALMTTYISHSPISSAPSSSTTQKIVNRAISSASVLVFSMSAFQFLARGLRRLYCERLTTFRFAALTCPQMMAAIATVTMASTAHSQCSTILNIASIPSSLVGQLVFLWVAVLVALGHSATGADSVSLRDGAAHGAGLGHPDGNNGEINNPASFRGFL